MTFTEFNAEIQKQFQKMCATQSLFESSLSGKQVYDFYLKSFTETENPVFRDPNSSVHNCNLCNNFIRRYGNIVAIDHNGSLLTLFGSPNNKGKYQKVATILNEKLQNAPVKDVFFETYTSLNSLPYEKINKTQNTYRLGIEKNHKRYTKEEAEKFGVVKPNEIRTFNHYFLDLPSVFVDKSDVSKESVLGFYRDKYSVFKRAIEEISIDTLYLVRDLINQGSLLDGTAHLHAVEAMIDAHKEHDDFSKKSNQKQLNNWFWKTSYSMDERTAKFKNTLIGVLCSELSEGEELNKACLNWNKRVDPANYHKATAPITKRQISEARKFVEENGYMQSFDRRLVTLDDINVSEIKHVSTNSEVKDVTIFDKIKPSSSTRHRLSQFDGVEKVHIEKFMKDILPTCTSIEAFVVNKHEGNFATLTTSKHENSKPIFKWSNNYSWTFNGNLAGKSLIKDAVKTMGGKVDGVLRFSINWAEGNGDNSDLDAWCKEPSGNKIGYSSNFNRITGGNLDIDIRRPSSHGNKNIVENITWPTLSKMKEGEYLFWVNQFSSRNSKGFKAEIEFDGEIYSYEYDQPVKGNIKVAKVTLKNGQFSIEHVLPSTNASKEIWGVDTNEFHKVNLVCLSPNHWGDNQVGNKHYFFMLENCNIPHSVRGFHNENLIPELLKHRKVMEVLGATQMIDPSKKRLSGLGFNSTIKDELIVKVKGSFKRTLKIVFN